MGRVSQVQRADALTRTPYQRLWLCIFCLLVSLLGACSSQIVKTANHVAVDRETDALPENQLLDVGVQVFGTGLDLVPDDDDLLIFPEVRKAESRFMPHQLMEALQSSAAWGAVRVVPEAHDAVDVLVQGDIIQSDGEMLLLRVKVTDASGRLWFEKIYEGLASKYAYERRLGSAALKADPFQGVYNQIANDMREYREQLNGQQLVDIRTISELRFARDFAPDAFGGHLRENDEGRYEITRLPAANDPMLARIRRIRERDYLFVDTMQQYYGNFVREMDRPYQEWRKQTYSEVMAMRELRRTARNRTIAGVAAILGGIAAAGSSGSSAAAGHVGLIGGGYLVKSGFDKGSQAKIHVEALQELGDSLEAEIQPRVIELEDRSITLSGTVENQYDQWREILKEIYRADTGGALPAPSGVQE
ncbi:hypothetical protein ACXYTJ_07425 [Gilvimarinus sp. F26214L]|uniref:hypothetical protein n=1 Tax=Gilvimarinus sp. DZF01 TaxID=3461371 RepID=UPI004045E651